MNVLVAIVMWMSAIIGLAVLAFTGIGIVSLLSGASLENVSIDVPPSELVTAFLGALVIFPGIIYICIQLRRILSTLACGDPFVPENASRLTKVAVAILVMQILRYVIAIGVGLLIEEADVTIKFELMTLASVAALFVLAQVFREGTRLRDEEKMTI
jgi:hypothetical protein